MFSGGKKADHTVGKAGSHCRTLIGSSHTKPLLSVPTYVNAASAPTAMPAPRAGKGRSLSLTGRIDWNTSRVVSDDFLHSFGRGLDAPASAVAGIM